MKIPENHKNIEGIAKVIKAVIPEGSYRESSF